MKVVAITGGTGFVGHKLVRRHLAAGDKVRVLTRRPPGNAVLLGDVSLHHADLAADSGALRPFLDGVDVLYHCAAELRDESRMHAVHVEGTKRLLDAAVGRCGRIVFLSSVGVYGRAPGGRITEQSPLQPEGTYEITKVEAEKVVSQLADCGRLPFAILRPSKIFGPEMRVHDLYQLIAFVARGWYFFIGQPGAVANYAHVDNVVEGLLLCGAHPRAPGGIFHVSDWRTLEDFVGVIATELGRKPPSLRIPEGLARSLASLFSWLAGFPLTESRITGLVNRTVYANDRIERELGYAHQVTIEEGLRDMVRAWHRRRERHY
jgi:nucleoside-diphosphate-sugar epimerase